MPRSRKTPQPPAPPASEAGPVSTVRAREDGEAQAIASIRAYLQTSLASIEAAVRVLGLGAGAASANDRDRWRRIASLLQKAMGEIEAARVVCAHQGPAEGAPDGPPPERKA